MNGRATFSMHFLTFLYRYCICIRRLHGKGCLKNAHGGFHSMCLAIAVNRLFPSYPKAGRSSAPLPLRKML